jgi:DNA-binding response OmpR family regulator
MSDRSEHEEVINPSPGLARGHILLVGEPESAGATAYRALLERAGYAVSGAPYDQAMTAPRLVGADVVILLNIDAGPSGLGIVRDLRTQADTRATPLIALTRCDDAYTREQIVRAGATAILIDPVKPPLLLRQLRRLLARTLIAAGSPASRAAKLTVTPAV